MDVVFSTDKAMADGDKEGRAHQFNNFTLFY
jgi:hypothetical protein